MQDTKVILIVNTETIADDTSYKREKSVIFLDNRGDSPGNGKNFDSKIDKGKKITWKARAMGSIWDNKDEDFTNVSVDIIKVEYKDGPRLLKKDIYEGTKKVVGYVTDEDQKGEEVYVITIRVNRPGSTPVEYIIDPKMHT